MSFKYGTSSAIYLLSPCDVGSLYSIMTIQLLKGRGEVHLIDQGIPYEIISAGEKPSPKARVKIILHQPFEGRLIEEGVNPGGEHAPTDVE